MAFDLWKLEIPNEISLALAAVALLLFAILYAGDTLGLEAIGWRLGQAFAMLVVAVLLAVFNALGAGDGKLLAAMFLWTDGEQAARLILLTALLGGLVALIVLILSRLPPFPRGLFGYLQTRRQNVPYALAIGIAGIILWYREGLFVS